MVSGAGNGVNNIQKRYIALYRATHVPWTQYELTEQPDLASECEARVLSAYEHGHEEEARVYFHRYRSIGVLPSTATWRKVLLLAYKEGDYHEIQSLFHTLITFGVFPDVTAWNFLLDILSKRGLVRKTEEVFWNAMQCTKGEINEFAIRSVFNCLMQEKRYLRAMVAYAGMVEYGYSITSEERKTLSDFCLQHLQERPGGLEALNVPEEDAEMVARAFKLDRITFGYANVLSCSDNLSAAGRNAVLTWYAKRATNLTAEQAFNHVLENARFVWESAVSSALGLDALHFSVIRGWISSGDSETLNIDANAAEGLENALSRSSPYNLGSFTLEDGSSRSLIVTKDSSGFKRQIINADGKPASADDASAVFQHLKGVKPLDFIRSTL